MTTSDNLRSNVKNLLMDKLSEYSEFMALTVVKKKKTIKQLEASCFDSIDPDNFDFYDYSDLIYKITEHLNPELVNLIINQESIITLSSQEMDKMASIDLITNINLRRETVIERTVSTTRKCPNCKHDKTTKREYNARASDEASIVKRECERCHLTF